MKKIGLNYLLFAVFIISAAFTSCDKNPEDNNGNGNGNEKEWVEISGVKWATCNVDKPGTFAAKSENAGMFYQWNRKTGWSSTDPLVNHEGGTTWDSSISEGDSWEKANNPCPTGWRVPTLEEQQSLLAAGSEWATLNGFKGRYFGSGEHTVFFPAAGGRFNDDGTLLYVDTIGFYCSSSPDNSDCTFALGFGNEEEGIWVSEAYRRQDAFSVRCVRE